MKFSIALTQIDSVPGYLRHNLDVHARSTARAKDGAADLIVFPELSLTGYAVKAAVWDLAVRKDTEGYIRETKNILGNQTER